jgi:hypothetical protein
MQINKYLILTPTYFNGSKRLKNIDVKVCASTSGTMAANAIALKLNLNLPDELFLKPQLEATINVDKDKVTAPVITAEILHNIQQEIQNIIGVDLKINIVEPIS